MIGTVKTIKIYKSSNGGFWAYIKIGSDENQQKETVKGLLLQTKF